MQFGSFEILGRKFIGPREHPLLIRYIFFRFKAFGVYLHHLKRSDFDRALHDHPWPFVSIMLKNGYVEEHDQTVDGTKVQVRHVAGNVILRPAEWRHRVIVDEGHTAWTLVLVGRRARKWGFHLPDGWCWWRKHNPMLNICEDNILDESGSD